jgi:hypothetical protein
MVRINIDDRATNMTAITTGRPGRPKTVNGLMGGLGGGGAGQLPSQSTQLQAGVSFCKKKD